MGTCTCQLHFHGDQREIINQMESPELLISNIPKDINSQLSNNSRPIKLKNINQNKIELIIKNKLSEIGHFISINEFHKYIDNGILAVMKKTLFKGDQYVTLPKLSSIKLDPFQFNDNQNIYHGSWNEECEMDGNGIYYSYNTKIIIEGIWSKGYNITGRIFFPNKDIYQGAIYDNKPHGIGELNKGNGDRYSGKFKHGDMISGEIIFADDDTYYKGDLKNGFFNGQGKMVWANKIEYEGYFENSMLSGKGKITKIIEIDKNEIYEGNFTENEFNGKGIYYFNNGDVYEGNFEIGIKKGYGKYKYITKGKEIIFEGNWLDDLPNGNGMLTYQGYELKGFWRNGDYMNSTEEENEIFNKIDKNIKPPKISIFPNSLSHINITNTSLYTQENFENFI